MLRVRDIRSMFVESYRNKDFVLDKTGTNTIEIVGSSFIADESFILRPPNEDYIKREIEWYDSKSLKVEDIPGTTPAIWIDVSNINGEINSNYGWCVYSRENYRQYLKCLETLMRDVDSRRAIMIYTRPSMQVDYNYLGMSDFMCTNTVQYLIRNGKLNAVVNMRSNDAVFGYNNDYAWQKTVLDRLVEDYNLATEEHIVAGDIIWQTGSIHVYERHFNLLETYL